jgi:hypothetical protein
MQHASAQRKTLWRVSTEQRQSVLLKRLSPAGAEVGAAAAIDPDAPPIVAPRTPLNTGRAAALLHSNLEHLPGRNAALHRSKSK